MYYAFFPFKKVIVKNFQFLKNKLLQYSSFGFEYFVLSHLYMVLHFMRCDYKNSIFYFTLFVDNNKFIPLSCMYQQDKVKKKKKTY